MTFICSSCCAVIVDHHCLFLFKKTGTPTEMKKISLIIPTRNEELNIEPLFASIEKMLKTAPFTLEVVVVDDGSTDGTREKVSHNPHEFDVQLVCRNHEKGLSTAVIAGARIATSDIIVVMDADLSHPTEIIPQLVAPLLSNSHDMVVGSRYTNGGETENWPIIRSLGSQLASLPAKRLTSINDPLSGFFAVRRDVLLAGKNNVTGFKIGLEIIARQDKNFRVTEVPIIFKDRFKGHSKMNAAVFCHYIVQISRLTSKRVSQGYLFQLMILASLTGLLDSTLTSVLTTQSLSFGSIHLLSFICSSHLTYLGFVLWNKQKISHSRRQYGYFLLFITLACYLQDGLLAIPVVQTTLNHKSFILSVFFSSAISWFAAILAASHPKQLSTESKIVSIIAYTIFLRLLYIGGPELIQEEAYYWNYAQHMATGYLDHPPMVALLIKMGTYLFGNNEFGVRIGAFGCWFMTAFFMYRLTQQLFDKKTALLMLLFLATLPIFFGTGVVITPDAPLIACWAGVLYFLYHALVKRQAQSWYTAGAMLGIGFASKYTIVLLGPAIIAYLLIDKNSRQWFIKPQPYIAVLLALLVASPVFFWNYQHEWASFLFQSQHRLQDSPTFATPSLLLYIVILLSPIGFISALHSLKPEKTVLKPVTKSMEDGSKRDRLFCILMTITPLAIVLIFSLNKEVKLNWTGPIWLSILPLMAHTLIYNKNRSQKIITRLWPSTIVALVLIYGTTLHYASLGLPGVPFPQGNLLLGWEDLAQQVEQTVQEAKNTNGTAPLVIGLDKYRIASGLSFYDEKFAEDAKSPTSRYDITGQQVLGRNALMYNYWFPAEQAIGRDLLLIAQKKKDLAFTRRPDQKNPVIGT